MSMAPTLVTRDGRTFLVLGSPGGARIITITLLTILNVIDSGMAAQAAVDAPRLHHQWLPDVVFSEPNGLSPDTAARLRDMGYRIVVQRPWGAAEMIATGIDPSPQIEYPSSGGDGAMSGRMRPGLLYGANDSRRPAGSAAGY